MTIDVQTFRQEVLALQPALMDSAVRMSKDEAEAHHLVLLTIDEALACETRPDIDTRVWLFGRLRVAFHSIARRRSARQERGHYATLRQLEDTAQPMAPA